MSGRLARGLALSGLLSIGLVTADVSAADDPLEPRVTEDPSSFREGPVPFLLPLPRRPRRPTVPGPRYRLSEYEDAREIVYAIGNACGSLAAIPAGTRSREVCDSLAQWIARGIDLEDIARDTGRMVDYVRIVSADCSQGRLASSELCEMLAPGMIAIFVNPPTPLRPFYPPGPPAPDRTVRVATNCAVVEVTPKDRGVTTEEKECAVEIIGEGVVSDPDPVTGRVTVEWPPDFCPAPSVQIVTPSGNGVGETLVTIELKYDGDGFNKSGPVLVERNIEPILSDTFSDGSSIRVDIVHAPRSSTATTFRFLSYAQYREKLITVGPVSYYPSTRWLGAHEIAHAFGLADTGYLNPETGVRDIRDGFDGQIMSDPKNNGISLAELKRIQKIAQRIKNGECEK